MRSTHRSIIQREEEEDDMSAAACTACVFCVRLIHRRSSDISRARRDMRIRLVPNRFHRPDSHSHSHSRFVVELCAAPSRARSPASRILLGRAECCALRLRPFPAALADFIPLHLRHSQSLSTAQQTHSSDDAEAAARFPASCGWRALRFRRGALISREGWANIWMLLFLREPSSKKIIPCGSDISASTLIL